MDIHRRACGSGAGSRAGPGAGRASSERSAGDEEGRLAAAAARRWWQRNRSSTRRGSGRCGLSQVGVLRLSTQPCMALRGPGTGRRMARGSSSSSSSSVAVVVEAASRSKGMSSGSNAPALRSEDEALTRRGAHAETWQVLEGGGMERAVRGGASGMSNGGWFNRWGDSAAGLGHRFAAAWVRVRAAFGDG